MLFPFQINFKLKTTYGHLTIRSLTPLNNRIFAFDVADAVGLQTFIVLYIIYNISFKFVPGDVTQLININKNNSLYL